MRVGLFSGSQERGLRTFEEKIVLNIVFGLKGPQIRELISKLVSLLYYVFK